jgi:DNA-binding NtrC family response regulator
MVGRYGVTFFPGAGTHPAGYQEIMKTVLIVDDEESILSVITEYLAMRDEELALLTATDGKKAMEIMQSSASIDLVITDLRMPVMDGFELIRYMAVRHPETPVIAMSGTDPGRVEALDIGNPFRYIEKPFLFEDLAMMVEGLI